MENCTHDRGEITCIDDLIRLGVETPAAIYRGQPRTGWPLKPRLHRLASAGAMLREHEQAIVREFVRWAHSLDDRLVQNTERDQILGIMQHYGADTRLLDWTNNALVAGYFATCSFGDADGEIWTVNPSSLNRNTQELVSGARVLLLQPFYSDASVKEQVGCDTLPEVPLAIETPYWFPRILLQGGVFTIHPLPPEGKQIEEVLRGENEIARYVVPCGCKEVIIRHLAEFGFTRRRLFPDIQNLASDLGRESPYAFRRDGGWETVSFQPTDMRAPDFRMDDGSVGTRVGPNTKAREIPDDPV